MSWNQMSEWWCKTMHSKASWPIHGRYICLNCHREYPVVWETTPPAVEYRRRMEPQPVVPPRENPLDEWARRISWSARLLFQRAAGGLKRSDSV